jgi:hypothetical protein
MTLDSATALLKSIKPRPPSRPRCATRPRSVIGNVVDATPPVLGEFFVKPVLGEFFVNPLPVLGEFFVKPVKVPSPKGGAVVEGSSMPPLVAIYVQVQLVSPCANPPP